MFLEAFRAVTFSELASGWPQQTCCYSSFELIESRKVKEKDLAARLIDSTIFKMNLDQRELFLVLEHKLGGKPAEPLGVLGGE